MNNAMECAELLKCSGEGDGFLFRIDARLKLAIAAICIFVVAFSSNLVLAVSVLFSSFSLAVVSRVPARKYLSRMSFPLLFAGFAALSSSSAILFARTLAAASILNLMTLVTPSVAMLEALSWLRVPQIYTNLAVLILRHSFIFIEESTKIHKAMEARGGFSSSLAYRKKLDNFATLAGMLLIKSLKKFDAVYAAMLSRGYSQSSKFYR